MDGYLLTKLTQRVVLVVKASSTPKMSSKDKSFLWKIQIKQEVKSLSQIEQRETVHHVTCYSSGSSLSNCIHVHRLGVNR